MTCSAFDMIYSNEKIKALGLNWIHEMSVVHRDLKPANILIDSHGVLKISDFGFAALKSNRTKDKKEIAVGTARYMAPEVLRGQINSNQSINQQTNNQNLNIKIKI